jgi:hypothetical protein
MVTKPRDERARQNERLIIANSMAAGVMLDKMTRRMVGIDSRAVCICLYCIAGNVEWLRRVAQYEGGWSFGGCGNLEDKRPSSYTATAALVTNTTEFRIQLCSQEIERTAGSLKLNRLTYLFYFLGLLLSVATSFLTTTTYHGATANFEQRAAQEEAPSLKFSPGRYFAGS